MCVCTSISHKKPISTLQAPILMMGINYTARSDLQFLRRNVQNGLCSTSPLLLLIHVLFYIHFLPSHTPSLSCRAVDKHVVFCFIWSKLDGCSTKLDEAERNPKAWYQTSDLSIRHRSGRGSSNSRVRRPNRPQTSVRGSPPHPLLLQNKPQYVFAVGEIRVDSV